MLSKNLILLLVILQVVACSDNSPQKTPTSSALDTLENSLVNRDWKLIGYEGVDSSTNDFTSETDFEFTIRFSAASDSRNRTVSGVNVCNAFIGDFALEENILSLANVTEDARACERSSEVPVALFARMLFSESPAMISVSNSRLEISSGANERLIFTDSAKVAVTEINSGDLTSLGNTVFSRPRYQVFRDRLALDEFHVSLVQCPCIIEGLPEVNFEDSTILFVSHEIVASGGYSIVIVNAEETSNGLTIEIQKTAPGLNCDVTDALTAQYKFYSVVGVYEIVDFVERPTLSPPCS